MFVVRSLAISCIFCLFFSDAYGEAEYELDTHQQYANDQDDNSISGRSLKDSEQDPYGEEFPYDDDTEQEFSISGRSLSSSDHEPFEKDYTFDENDYGDNSISGRSLASTEGEYFENEQDYAYDQENFGEESISGRSLDMPEEDLYDDYYDQGSDREQSISGRSLLSSELQASELDDYEQDQLGEENMNVKDISSSHDISVEDEESGMELPIAERSLSSISAGLDCGKTPNTPSVRNFLQIYSI